MLKNKKIKFPFGIIDLFIIISLISLLKVQINEFANDPGLGWHLKNGKNILQTLSIPYQDNMLGVKYDKLWIADQWLGDVLIAKLKKIASWPLVYAFFSVIYLLTFYFILFRGLRKHSQSFFFSAIVSVLAFKISQIHFVLRPVMLSFIFFAHLAVRLWDIKECKKIRRQDYMIFFVLFLSWANLHPSFLLGLFILVIFTFFDLKLLPLSILSALSTLINPYFYKLHLSIMDFGKSEFLTNFFSEWRPLELFSLEGKLYLLLLSMFLVFSLVLLISKKLPKNYFLILVLTISFAYLAYDSVRMIPFFGIVVAFPICILAKNVFKIFNVFLNKIWPKMSALLVRTDEREGNLPAGIYTLFSACFLLFATSLTGKLIFFEGEFGPSVSKYPYKAVDFLKKRARQNHNKIKVANEFDWGGFITWYGRGRVLATIDDRSNLHGEERYKLYNKSIKSSANFRAYLAEINTKYIILEVGSKLSTMLKLEKDFKSLYADDIAVIFKKL